MGISKKASERTIDLANILRSAIAPLLLIDESDITGTAAEVIRELDVVTARTLCESGSVEVHLIPCEADECSAEHTSLLVSDRLPCLLSRCDVHSSDSLLLSMYVTAMAYACH